MYLNNCCDPGGSCPICNAIEPPELELTYVVWEEPPAKYPEEAYGLVRFIVQDNPDDVPELVDLIADYDPETQASAKDWEAPTLTLDQIKGLAASGNLDGELHTTKEL